MKLLSRLCVIALMLLVMPASLQAQDQRLRMSNQLSRDALLEDMQLMSDILTQAHPGMYLHVSKEAFTGKFNAAVDELKASDSQVYLRQFFLLATEALDPIRC